MPEDPAVVEAEALPESESEPEPARRKRRRRRNRPRSKSVSTKKLTRAALAAGRFELDGYLETEAYSELLVARPHTWGECREDMRPCPWVACKHHLYLDVDAATGTIKINFPDLEPWELQHTCARDVAARGGITLEEVGEIMNLTRERVRQLEVRGLIKTKRGLR